jgi:PAS domain S-box-containing protein
LLVLCALLVTFLIDPDTLVAPLFFLAITLSAWVGGMGPGLAAASLATLAVAYFFLPPKYTLWFNPAELVPLLVFFVSAVVVSSWSAVRQRAETLLRRARDELEAKVQERTEELTHSNEQLRAEVAEREKAEAVLREQASLLNLTHDTVFVRDMNDVISYWNRGAAELYGWKKEEAIGRITHQLMQTVFPEPLEQINEELFRTGRWEGELVHTKREGTQVVVASRWSLQRDEHGRPVAILETNNDVTERRQAEEALRKSEEQWRAVFEDNPTMYFMVDGTGTVLSVNPFGAEQLGYTVEELVGDSVLKVFHEADREAAQRNVALCLEQFGQALNWELRKIRKDGTVLWVRETAKAMRRAKSDPVVLVVCEDITERRLAQEALQKAQAELAHVTRVTTLGELTASIAHEVNQPLAAVVMNGNACLRWLGGERPNLDEARAALQRIIRDGHRASEVIERIRALVKKTTSEKVRLDVNELIREVVTLAQSEVRKNQVRLRTELAADLPSLLGDRVQLQQVVLNLVVNGIEAMSKIEDRPRELVIKTQKDETGKVLVSVQDSGIGLDVENMERIFRAFYTTKPQGMGMGLSISRSIIEAHGGELSAAANGGRGATFQFTLPPSSE